MSRPLLFLDVDGVLAPWGAGLDQTGFESHDFGAGSGVWLRRADGERLRRLGDRFEIVWCTARMADVADTIAVALDLPGLEVMPFDRSELDDDRLRWAEHAETWKLPWVDLRARGRAAAWVDDELGSDVREWAAHRPEPTLILEPASNQGLAEGHWEALERFVA